MKRPSIKDRESTPAAEATAAILKGAKTVNRQDDKTVQRHIAKTAEKPQKLTFYFSRKTVQALMTEQLRRVTEGAARRQASLSALVEEAILHKYG